MALALLPTDEISRCIIFDRAFEGDVHVDSRLFRFESRNDADGSYHESGVLRRLAAKIEEVHLIGCLIAETQNARKAVPPPPGLERRYYCGFRTALYSQLPTLGNGYTITITHSPEDGIDAHVDFQLAFDPPLTSKSARATRRTDAGLAIAEQFGCAEPHCCDCDKGDEHHPLLKWGPRCLDGQIIIPPE